jgi:hypothetical protein
VELVYARRDAETTKVKTMALNLALPGLHERVHRALQQAIKRRSDARSSIGARKVQMQRATLALLLLTGTVSSCATPQSRAPAAVANDSQQIKYLAPKSFPARASTVRVARPYGLVWSDLLGALERSGLTVEATDVQAGYIVATYEGAPDDYVDCGWIVTYGGRQLNITSGSAGEATLNWPTNDGILILRRRLTLDGRMVVQLQPAGQDTLVSVDTTYVLTKGINLEEPSGQRRASDYEVVSFATGDKGRFSVGTVCQPTGTFELLAFDVLPAQAAMGTRGGAAPRPRVAVAAAQIQESDLQCGGADSVYCQVRDITAPYRQANEQQSLGLAVTAFGGRGATLFEGDRLALDINFPSYDSYLHVVYFQRDGTVGSLIAGDEHVWPANAQHYVEETQYEIAPPFGIEAISAIASEEPLFTRARPRFESAGDYLAALRQRLADLKATYPDTQIAADFVLVRTEPSRSMAGSSS